MNYDAWKTTPPDDDPEGQHQDEKDRCPSCLALEGQPCDPFCDCARCRAREAERDEADTMGTQEY